MILTIEIGNSTITLGGVEGSDIRFECRINTDRVKTSDTYCIDLKTLFEIYGIDVASIEGVIISSVVPQVPQEPGFRIQRPSSYRQSAMWVWP